MINKLKYLVSSLKNLFSHRDSIYYISEIEDWVIKEIGKSISQYSSKKVILRFSSLFIKNSIIHFGSLNTYLNQLHTPHKSNKLIVTWYHIPHKFILNDIIKDKVKQVDIWITSNSISKFKLLELGISPNKIKLIPIAVESIFQNSEKKEYKDFNETFVIGSFLKDGSGWGQGNKPKYIKGPDILAKTLIELNKNHNISVKLSGPSRGYVITRLKENNVRFEYNFFEDKNKLIEYYKACDICLITSREEGGPLSLLESMILGIPVVSTKVGMAVDVIKDNFNGYLIDIDDVDDLVKKISILINNRNKLKHLSDNCKSTEIKGYNSISKIMDDLYER